HLHPRPTSVPTSEQTFSAGDGSMWMYCRLRNAEGESVVESDGITIDATAPQITGVLPADNAVEQPVDVQICVVFDDDMTDEDFTSSTCTVLGSVSGAIATDPTYDGTTDTVTFNVTEYFEYGETVTATISGSVRDKAGNELGSVYTWEFTTTAVPIPPVLQSMVLRDRTSGDTTYSNERSVNVALIAAGGPTHMRFARTEVALLSAPWRNYAQTLEQMLGADEGEQRLWCELKNDIGTGNSASGTITLDTEAPSIVSVIPSDDALGQPADSAIVVEFDDDMLSTDFTNATVTVQGTSSGSHVTYPTYSDRELVLNQAGDFTYGETVQCTVKASIRDKAENALGSDYTWTFPISTSDTPPVLASVTITDRTSGSVDYTDEEDVIVNMTVSGSPWEMRMAGSEADLALAVWQSFALSFSHTLDTADGEKTVWVQARNAIGEGNALSGTIVLDTTDPSVSSVVPPDGATGIMTDAVIKIVLSEPMVPGLVNPVNMIGSVSGAHGLTAEYDNESLELVLRRQEPFTAGELVTCTLTVVGVDRAGNTMFESLSWSFTVDSSPVSGGGSSGGGGGCFVRTASSISPAGSSGR
ncbi:Ig-like domain-containing protein, partial [Planctomycetota bacterium]